MAGRRSHKVGPRGIQFRKQYYTAPELASLVGSKVDIRFLPSDDTFIEVFSGDDWVCTAFLHANLTDTQRSEIRSRNQAQYTDARAYLVAAKGRRLTTVRTPGSGVIVTLPTTAETSDLAADPEALLALAEAPSPEDSE